MRRALLTVLAATSLLAGVGLTASPAASAAPAIRPAAPTTDQLTDSSPGQPRDLSRPDSRLALNPTVDALSRDTPVQQTGGPDLPLSANYFANDQEPGLRDLLTVGETPPSTPTPIRPQRSSPVDDTFGAGTDGWAPTSPDVTVTTDHGTLVVGSGAAGGVVERRVTVDLDAFPVLRVGVLSTTTPWSVAVVADGAEPVVLQPDTATPGVSAYDVPARTGWHGRRTFTVRVSTHAAGTVSIDEVRLQSRDRSPRPTTVDDEFTGRLDPRWRVTAGRADTAGGSLRLRAGGRGVAAIDRDLDYDLDAFPYAQLTVSGVRGRWTVAATVDGHRYPLQRPVAALGTFTYDLPRLTGRHGPDRVRLELRAEGRDASLTVDDVQVAAAQAPAVAVSDEFASDVDTRSCTLADTGLDPAWTASPGTTPCARVSDGALHLTRSAAAGYGSIQRRFALDVTRYPDLDIDLPALTGAWVLRISTDPTFATDAVQIQPLSLQAGHFSYDIPKKTGWSGPKTFYVRIDAASYNRPDGTPVAPDVTVDRIAVRAAADTPWLGLARSTTNRWAPNALGYTGSYADGSRIAGRDAFHDADSVSRALTVSGLRHGRTVQLAGLYRGRAALDPYRRVLTVTAPNYRYSVALPPGARLRWYADKDALQAGGPALAEPATASGYWAATVPDTGRITAGLGFAPSDRPADTAARHAQAAATPLAAVLDPVVQARYWDAFLRRVPQPADFGIGAGLPTNGVTPQRVRSLYYRAWIFLESDVVPVQTEAGQRHVQVATGKPSTYHFGAPGASAVATWDSVAGIQLLAHVDPDNAWSGLQEIADHVPADGAWPGEPLPAREMQTAWILYRVTGRTDRLREVYPALRRLLTYKLGHLAYSSSTTTKDMAFTASALQDLTFAERIAAVVGDTGTDWAGAATSLTGQAEAWFWPTPSTPPSQYYVTTTGQRTLGNVMSTTPALAIPGLDDDRVASTVARFDSLYDPTAPLAGFGNGGPTDAVQNDVRYGIVDYTTAGLLAHGQGVAARTLANAILRDTVIADVLSERYQYGPGVPPHGEGNTPSLFGAAELIWAVWLNNGLRIDTPTR